MNFIGLAKKKYYLLVIFLLLVVPFFFVGGPTRNATSLFRAIWDCGHFAFFGLFIFLIHSQIALSNWRRWLAVSALVFVIGGTIEIVQSFVGRDGNWYDLLRDLSGAWIVLFFLQPNSKAILLARALAIVLTLPSLFAVYSAASLKIHRVLLFPQLADFESSAELNNVRGRVSISNDHSSFGQSSLKVRLTGAQYGGVTFKELMNDWRHYSKLEMDIYNPDSVEFDVVIRVNDSQHDGSMNSYEDRFNQTLHLIKEWNHINIDLNEIKKAPETREMNMADISTLMIFSPRATAAKEFYIDNIRLE